MSFLPPFVIGNAETTAETDSIPSSKRASRYDQLLLFLDIIIIVGGTCGAATTALVLLTVIVIVMLSISLLNRSIRRHNKKDFASRF